MKKYFDILRHCSLFDNIRDENLIPLLGCLGAHIKTFDKNETLMAEGERTGAFGIVLSGAVQLTQLDCNGNRSIISEIGETCLFGEDFACADIAMIPLDVVASTSGEAMFIECSRVLHTCCNACEFHTQIIYNLMKNIAQKNILFHRKLQITSRRSTREKLLTYLQITSKEKASSSFDIPYDRQTLADFLEVDRSGLSAEISKLRKEGIIENRKNHFRLLSLN